MKNKIYTTGCAGKDVTKLPFLLDKLNAILTDIRFTPHSRHLEWRREYLELLLKNRYHHLAAFGNRAFRENAISISNFDLGLKILQSWNENVILMCDCEEPQNCHRFLLLKLLREKDFEVEEIEIWTEINKRDF